MGVAGHAAIECTVQPDLTLGGCVVQSEEPLDQGFGAAALKLSTLFKMRPTTKDGRPVNGGKVVIPIRFELPAEPSPPPSP
jgi:protein TonB